MLFKFDDTLNFTYIVAANDNDSVTSTLMEEQVIICLTSSIECWPYPLEQLSMLHLLGNLDAIQTETSNSATIKQQRKISSENEKSYLNT